jgi:lambda family phage tail tape measure protein
MQDIATLSIDVDSTQVRKSTGDLGSLADSAKATESSVFSLEKAFVALAAALAAAKIVDMAKDATLLAARYETLGTVMTVMGNNTGLTSGQMTTLQLELEKTGISSIKARESLNMLAAAHVGMADAAKLARVAQDAAVIAGMNSSEAFEILTKSVQTGIAMQAHHLGVMVNYENAYKKMKDTVGAYNRDLTDAEKTQARMNEVLSQGTKLAGAYEAAMGTAGKQLTSMVRYVENLEVSVGGLFGPAFTSAIQGATDGLKRAQDGMKAMQESGDAAILGSKIKSAFDGAISSIVAVTKYLYDHRQAVLSIGIAWASISIGTKVFEMVTAITAWIAAQRAAATASIQARLAKEADSVIALKNAGSLVTLTAAEEGVVRAEIEATAAIQAKSMAANTATVAIEAMTIAGEAAKVTFSSFAGIFSVIITLVSTAAMAMFAFKESATKSSDDAMKAGQDYKKDLEEQLEAQKKFWELKSKGVKTEDAIKETIDSVDLIPQIKKLTEVYGELQSKRKTLEDSGSMNTGWVDENNINAIKAAIKTYDDLGTAMKDVLALRYELVEKANLARGGAQGIEARRIADAAATGGEIPEAKDKSMYASELLRIELELVKVSKENTLQSKAKAEIDALDVELKQNALRWDTEAKKKDGKLNADQAKDLEKKDATTKLVRRLEIEKELADAVTAIDASTQAKLRMADRETWSAKLQLWDESFRKMNEDRKKAGLAEFDSAKKAGYIQNNAVRETPQEISRLNTELKKLEEEKGRALTFKEQIAALDELSAKIDASQVATKKLKDELKKKDDKQGDFFGGMKEGMVELGNSMSDLFTEGKKMATDFANKATDALTRFAMGGKSAFKDLLKYIMEEIVRFLMAKAVTMFISAFMGGDFGKGGATSTYNPGSGTYYGPPKATGGPVAGGMNYLVGERGPEIFTAPAAGKIIPNDQLYGGGNTQNHIEVNVTVHKDGTTSTSSSDDNSMAKKIAGDVVAIVDRRISEHMRSGGKLNPTTRRA